MSLKSIFATETLATFQSEFNGEVKVIESVGRRRVECAGLIQSGDVMVWIWSQGIFHLLPKDYRPESILILGLGGGSALFWLRRHFPKAHLAAVEIDPIMIKIAKDYFNVAKIKNLTIVNDEAVSFIKKTKNKYSLILMDCYQGHQTPPGFDDPKVLAKMKSLCDYLLINRLYWDQFKIDTDDFVAKVSPHFRIKSVYTRSNLVISLNQLESK